MTLPMNPEDSHKSFWLHIYSAFHLYGIHQTVGAYSVSLQIRVRLYSILRERLKPTYLSD